MNGFPEPSGRMKHLVWLAVLALGCTDPTAPLQDLHIAATVATSAVRVGSFVRAELSITNEGNRTRKIPPSDCPPPLEISNEDGEIVGPGPAICNLDYQLPVPLAPGETLTIEVFWVGNGDDGRLLPPGNYRLRGAVRTQYGTLTSEAVPIQFLPAQ